MAGAVAGRAVPGPVRRLLVSHALASVGMSIPWPLLLVLVWVETGDGPHGELALGVTAAARMLPGILLSWASGMLADRFRRDRLLRVTFVARVVLLGGVAAAVSQGWLLVAIIAAALAVASGTPAYPALAAAMPGAAGEARRRATDLLVTIEVASFVVGPALGGLLLAAPTRPVLPLVAVLLLVLAVVTVRGVVLPRPIRDTAGRTPDHRTDGRLSALRASSAARAVGVAGVLNAVTAVLLLALLPVSGELWKSGESGYGLAAGMVGLGALGGPLLWWLGSSTRARARGGLLLLGGALAVLPLTPAVSWAVLPLLVAGATAVHVEGAVTEAIQDAVPDWQRAGTLGLTDSVILGASLLGSLAAPWLSSALGPRGVLGALAVTSVATVGVLGRHRQPRPPTRGGPQIPAQWAARAAVPTSRARSTTS